MKLKFSILLHNLLQQRIYELEQEAIQLKNHIKKLTERRS